MGTGANGHAYARGKRELAGKKILGDITRVGEVQISPGPPVLRCLNFFKIASTIERSVANEESKQCGGFRTPKGSRAVNKS